MDGIGLATAEVELPFFSIWGVSEVISTASAGKLAGDVMVGPGSAFSARRGISVARSTVSGGEMVGDVGSEGAADSLLSRVVSDV